jgi:ABC-2 type transport system permease protein
MGLIGLPVHQAAYREHSVLRRLRASGMPLWSVLGAQVAVTLAVSILGSALIMALANLTYDVQSPASVAGVLGAFLLGTRSFAALGVLLGAVLPTARAAQGAGVLLWFVMLMISGAGPPPEVLNDTLTRVADATPLKHVILTSRTPGSGSVPTRPTCWSSPASWPCRQCSPCACSAGNDLAGRTGPGGLGRP